MEPALSPDEARALILRETVREAPLLVPEIVLHLVTESCPLWRAREADLAALGLADPYWAFAWAGGQALARFVLDHEAIVRGRAVLDVGSGSGLVAIAAALRGARAVMAADVDPVAAEAIALNAAAAGVELAVETRDLIGAPVDADVILAGDVTYEAPLSARLMAWLGDLASAGRVVLIGDPGRGFVRAPEGFALEGLATYDAPADIDLRGQYLRPSHVLRLRAS